jgi:hypothetical protein
MVLLPEHLLFKKGRYDKNEYEEMKRHVHIGEALVGPVVEPSGLARMIRHHHERWDGYGYPDGLKEDEIPAGARIVAVADMFNAQVSSRNYRTGLPFDNALEDLKAARGTQLDPAMVNAFVRWWQRKQSAQPAGNPLEPCWEMKMCPAPIALACPAYSHATPCWLVKGTKCEMHGDKCPVCIVFTENLSRIATLSGGSSHAPRHAERSLS